MAPYSPAFLTADAFVAPEEGGYSSDPHDPGNFINGVLIGTNWGISAETLQEWTEEQGVGAVTAADMKALTAEMAQEIRHDMFWEKIQGDALPAGIGLQVYDEAINAGVSASAKLLQASVGADQDGIVGPATLAAVAGISVADVLAGLVSHQAAAYAADGDFPEYGLVWLARLGARTEKAASIAAGATS